MKITLSEKESRVVMDCISIVIESIDSDVVMATLKERERIEKINLDDLYVKIHKNHYEQHPKE